MNSSFFKNIVILASLASIVLPSCRKTINSASANASLTFLNAVSNSNPIITNFSPVSQKSNLDSFQYFATALEVNFGSATEFTLPVGSTTLSLVQLSDTTSTLWSGSFNFAPNSINSFFVMGDTLDVDTMLVIDRPPFFQMRDSSFGIRFVNLARGSQPVSVDIAGNSVGSEVSSLSYKGITEFKSYAANAISPNTYTFEFRDVTTGQLVGQNTTYTFADVQAGVGSNTDNNNYRYRNFTVALIGDPSNGGSELSVVLVNNY